MDLWSLQPVLPRQNFFTKEIHRLLSGGRQNFGRSAETRFKAKAEEALAPLQKRLEP